MGIRRFPSIMIKTRFQDRFQTILCYEGYLDCAGTCGLIQSVLLACESEIAQAAEISSMRAIQNEQDAAYYKSLEIDRMKMKSKSQIDINNTISSASTFSSSSRTPSPSETAAAASEITQAQMEENDTLSKRINVACQDLKAESYEDSIRFQFVFPDGKRHLRRFSPTTTTFKVSPRYIFFFFIYLFFFLVCI